MPRSMASRRRAVEGEVEDVEGAEDWGALASEAVLSLRCLSQKAKAAFFLPGWLTGSSMLTRPLAAQAFHQPQCRHQML